MPGKVSLCNLKILSILSIGEILFEYHSSSLEQQVYFTRNLPLLPTGPVPSSSYALVYNSLERFEHQRIHIPSNIFHQTKQTLVLILAKHMHWPFKSSFSCISEAKAERDGAALDARNEEPESFHVRIP
jgi:hypothetical protein